MKKLIPICLLALSLGACSHKNELTYFSGSDQIADIVMPIDVKQLTIQPTDELFINVSSEVPQATLIYNMPLQNPAISDELLVNTSTSRQQTYKVTKDGDITMPTLGKIHVEGMTTNELSEYLTRRIAQDVEGPFVRVELVNFKINVIGEVNSPGAYTFSNERVSVLDALAQAGDMTIFGRRENVTIVREENGKVAYHKLDLTDSKVVNSPYYYLKQNDVVYVEPTEVKKGQSEYNQNNSYKVSVVSAIVSGCSVVVSLLIALLVK